MSADKVAGGTTASDGDGAGGRRKRAVKGEAMQSAAAKAVVAATGDITMDWMSARSAVGATAAIDLSRVWGQGFICRDGSQAGGAALAGEMTARLLAAGPAPLDEVPVVRPVVPGEALASPLYSGFTRTYMTWSEYPAAGKGGGSAWRIAAYRGENPGTGEAPTYEPPDAGMPSHLLVDDLNLGFRDRRGQWPELLTRAKPRAIVVKMAAPLAAGELWSWLAGQHADVLTVIMTANELRKDYRHVGYSLSWEQLAEQVAVAVRAHEVSRAARVIVFTSVSGAVIVERRGPDRLVYDAHFQEGDWERQYEGGSVGYLTAAAAALVREYLARGAKADVVAATKRALAAMRALHQTGYVMGGGDGGLEFPFAAVVAALSAEPGVFADVNLDAVVRGGRSILVAQAGRRGVEELASAVAISGPRSALRHVPVETIGNWSSVDRAEIESIRSVRNLMGEYIGRHRRGERLERPLSIAVFGPPGAGKSFAVKQIAGALLPGELRSLEFNLSQFRSEQELAAAFHQVRDTVLEQRLPLVFWDEFDTTLDGQPLGWLRHFLAPMQDGCFREAGVFRPIGPAIFVFAGGTSASLAEFVHGGDEAADRAAKKPDFLSRLRGYVNVYGPNPVSEDDHAFPLRRAFLLRALVTRKAPQLVRDGVLAIDDGVLRAFIGIDRFRHGARSMEAIIDMSSLAGRLRYERAGLPPRHELALHVDADQFLALVGEPPETLSPAGP